MAGAGAFSDAGAAAGVLLAKWGGATIAVGAGEIGTSIADCTLPAFTVMVFTFTGLIGSAEPGFGCGASAAATGGGDWMARVSEAEFVSPCGRVCAARGTIASARAKRGVCGS